MKNRQEYDFIDSLVVAKSKVKGIGFMELILEKILHVQNDELDTIITDLSYVTMKNKGNNKDNIDDRGIDAIYLDEEKKEVHIFNFKYIENYGNTENNFDGGELNKIQSVITDILEKNTQLEVTNIVLSDKIREIWDCMKSGIYDFKIHFVSNGYKGFASAYEDRLNKFVSKDTHLSYDYILMDSVMKMFVVQKTANQSSFMAIEKNFLDKSGPGVRSYICEIKGSDLIRISLEGLDIKQNTRALHEDIKLGKIDETVFEQNVRNYLQQKTTINKNIIKTAQDEILAGRFFYYNNGITIICEHIDYAPGRSPIVSLTNYQIVNGSQTVHALKDAFDINYSFFDDITVLVRIYETRDDQLFKEIAEYTNSQNPVKSKDLHSNDSIQIKIEEYFKSQNIIYDRKGVSQNDGLEHIDSEKLGQILMAYKLEMPGEAKNKKSLIFGAEYDNIFIDALDYANMLKIYNLYKFIENKRKELNNEKKFLNHSTLYILYIMKLVQESNKSINDNEVIFKKSLEVVEAIREKEKEKLGEEYSDGAFFKRNKIKDYIKGFDLSI